MKRTLRTQVLLAAASSAAVVGLPTWLGASDALAAPDCRVVETQFTPQGFPSRGGREELSPQIAVWVEKTDGTWVKDLYLTRAVGSLGLGNRPGQALLKSDFRWPYGRRPMALPMWAYRRGKTYPAIAMGGKCSPNCPVDFQGSPSDDDNTIAYHGPVSSTEPYYCSPSGWRTQTVNGVDVVSCASAFYGSKGWYKTGATSVYPPRADLVTRGGSDAAEVLKFASDNDVAAISAATPANGKAISPVQWFTTPEIPDGDYNLMVEVNIEGDFNQSWQPGKAVPEPHSEWNHLGKDPFGQPSILYRVPFRLDGSGRVATASDYAGYGDWRGDSGVINPPDNTISSSGGSGADRLRMMTDDAGSWRVKVAVTPCDPGMCDTPLAPAALDTSEGTDSTMVVKFQVPQGPPAASYQVRYQSTGPITADNWAQALPATATNLAPPGSTVSTRLVGLIPKTKYYVAVRPKSRCGADGAVAATSAETGAAQFATLSGCFIATAAYGSDLEPEVAMLRRFRDRYLLTNPLGQAAVASYYTMSPSLASLIAKHEPLRQAARAALTPVVQLVRAARLH